MNKALLHNFFLVMCEANGLPIPWPEYKFHPSRKFRFDFCFTESKVAVEVEGGVWVRGRHLRPLGYIKDMAKYNEAAILGYKVLRFTPQQINNGEAMQAIRRALGLNDAS